MRHPQWPERLIATVDRFRDQPFGWGSSDCFDLLAECVEAVTGEALYPECRGQYADKAGAFALLAEHGFADMGELCASLGAEIPTANAGRGDVGVIADGQELSAAVCMGRLWVCRTPGPGLAHVPRSFIKRSWRIA